ncbi:uncharacterized protein LOC132545034 [Ylistrum balloti]|uniref:uncharacterized protein LOC132545034 n=1 Tax=Ylistrum balloti TaxID=509963 RepID=UPI002905A5A0|nr:uncharacterized protein LOC132545034 [Ylistrum balloti]
MAATTTDTPMQSTSKHGQENSEDKDPTKFRDIWRIKPCRHYIMAYELCRDWRTKYYHRYWDGEKDVDCSSLRKNVKMCEELAENESVEAYEYLLKVEEAKCQKRLDSVQNNDVWEYRTSPPTGWYTNMINNDPATVSQVEGREPKCEEDRQPFPNRHVERYSPTCKDQGLSDIKPKLWLKPLSDSYKDSGSMCVIS